MRVPLKCRDGEGADRLGVERCRQVGIFLGLVEEKVDRLHLQRQQYISDESVSRKATQLELAAIIAQLTACLQPLLAQNTESITLTCTAPRTIESSRALGFSHHSVTAGVLRSNNDRSRQCNSEMVA